jgi:protease-4
MFSLRLVALLCALLFAVPRAALAQTASVQHGDLSRGATLPPTSAALVDDAMAPLVNPAGLAFISGGQFSYLHERSVGRGQLIDGLYTGTSLLGLLAGGFDIEWIRGGGPANRRRLSWSLALGGAPLSLGASYHSFSSENPDFDALTTWDIGLASRPSRYFALGVAIQNLGQPSHGALGFNRQYDFALALRPLGERITLAADYLLTNLGDGTASRMQYTLQAPLLRGVTIGAGLSHGVNRSEGVFLQASATIDLAHFGLTYSLGGSTSESSSGLDHIILARFSTQSYPALRLGPGKFALLDLGEITSKSSGSALSFLGIGEADPYLRLLRLLSQAERDGQLEGLVLKIDNLSDLGVGKAEEVRRIVLRLRARGKKIIAVLLRGGDSEYLIASAADKVFAVPEALLAIKGFSATVLFAGSAMEKLGVRWEVARVGAYKNAPDLFTRSEMSPEQRETVNAYLDSDVRTFQSAVGSARRLDPGQIKRIWDEGLLPPSRAKELGLIDEVISPGELESRAFQIAPGTRYEAHYRPQKERQTRWGERKRIAIVPVIGTIASGKDYEDPFGLVKVAGAETVVRALRRAQDDPLVAAIVLRVDSPGGDSLGSDLMYRAVLEAKKRKPVIASMGDVAASGGYAASMGADQIFALPTTITGSIGVFFIKPVVDKLANKLGVHHETIKRGKLSDLFNLFQPWTPEEKIAAQKWVDATYDSFITEVSACRKMSKSQVDGIARGRVWSGEDAQARGLVDQMGGLLDAVEAARVSAHIVSPDDVDIAIVGEPHGLLGALAESDGLISRTLGETTAAHSPLPAAFRELAADVGLDQALLLQPTVKAMMPFTLKVR